MVLLLFYVSVKDGLKIVFFFFFLDIAGRIKLYISYLLFTITPL